MSIEAVFDDSLQKSYLKPNVAIECFLGELALKPTVSNITTLIKLILEDKCDHSSFPVNCVAIDETAAEKWVALTRRVAGTQIKSRLSDKHLVRHLYDLYHLGSSDLLTGEYRLIVRSIMEKDRTLHINHNPAYANDPLRTSELALEMLIQDSKWREHWDIFLEQMVYDEHKPDFATAYEGLQLLSKEIIQSVN